MSLATGAPLERGRGDCASRLLAVLLFVVAGLPAVCHAQVIFNGVAAGDMTSSDAVLWTRAGIGSSVLLEGSPSVVLQAQIATDPDFHAVVATLSGTTDVGNNNTLKLLASGLTPNTHYYYRFTKDATTSMTGQFNTLPDPGRLVPFKIGFSGDANQSYRPYPSMAGFGTSQNPGSMGLNAFIFLGDVIYEKSAGSLSAPTLSPSGTTKASDLTADFYTKLNQLYVANISGVASSGAISPTQDPGIQQGLQSLYAATGLYTVIDNHEIWGSLQVGGAPLAAAKQNSNSGYAVNTTGQFNNKSAGFFAETKAFFNNTPTAINISGTVTSDYGGAGLTVTNLLAPTSPTLSTPLDARSDGTPVNYFTRSWGLAANYIQTDDRTYRDARLGAPVFNPLTPDTYSYYNGGAAPVTTATIKAVAQFDSSGNLLSSQQDYKGDAIPGVWQAGNERSDRTMLGQTQLEWAEAQLLASKASKAKWTVIAVSTPIDQVGPDQDSKSWAGGYPAERNALLKYIAENKVGNVVFLTTDDHNMRVTQLQYQPDMTGKPELWVPVPNAFQILSGPMGAIKPDTISDHSFSFVQMLTDMTNGNLAAFNQPQLGLVNYLGQNGVNYPGLTNVVRNKDGVLTAESVPTSVDFYAPDKFGYTTLNWNELGDLRVEFWGSDSYDSGVYPSASDPSALIMGFSIAVPVTIAGTETVDIAPDADAVRPAGVVADGVLNIARTTAGLTITTLAGSGTVHLGAKTLTLSDAADTFTGGIDGSGGLTILAGHETLSGANSYGGTTLISGGTLSVNGSITSPVTVGAGGALRGTGLISNAVSVLAGGILAPGNSPGTLTIQGPVNLESGSTTRFDVDGTGTGNGPGNFSRLLITGAAAPLTVHGGIAVQLRGITGAASNSYTPTLGARYEVIQSQGGVAGSFSSLVQPPSGLAAGTRFDVLYDPHRVTLAVTPDRFASLSSHRWSSPIASSLDASRPQPGVRMTDAQSAVYLPLYSQSAAQLAFTMEQMMPLIYSDSLMANRSAFSSVASQIHGELRTRRGTPIPDNNSRGEGPGKSTVWISGAEASNRLDAGQNGLPGYTGSTGGATLGGDILLNPSFLLGAAFSFKSPDIRASNGGSFRGDYFQMTAYGSWKRGVFFVDGQAGAVVTEGSFERDLSVNRAHATSRGVDGGGAGGSLRGGVRLPMGGWNLEPSLSISGLSLRQGAATEQAQGTGALHIGRSSLASLQWAAGLEADRWTSLGGHFRLLTSMEAGVTRELLDTDVRTKAGFVGLEQPGFTVANPPTDRTSLVAGIHLTLETGTPFQIFAGYDASLTSLRSNHALTAGLRYSW